MEYVVIALLAVCIVLLVLLLLKKPKTDLTLHDSVKDVAATLKASNEMNIGRDKALREEIAASLARGQSRQAEDTERLTQSVLKQLAAVNDTTSQGLEKIRLTTEERLDKLQGVVDEKLSKTLNERLDSNFKQIGDSLGELYKSLGELKNLSGGVNALNRTLSNVKTRGVWGEQQLAAILEQTMTPSQYDTNVITKRGSSDRVEFAVKLPNKSETNDFTYLPIDSKLPTDIYDRIALAAENSDKDALTAATKELETRIKTEAKTIAAKYIDVPNTTDFAVMFLPTEGLYAEVLRIPGLTEYCQTQHHIFVTGPTTVTAFLNSLRVGFANVALNEKSKEVMKLLTAVNSQYEKFGVLIDGTLKKLDAAVSSTNELKHRTDIIRKTMRSVETIDSEASDKLLGFYEN